MLSAEKELFYTTVLCNLARGDVTERPKKLTEKTDWWTVVWSDNVSDRWFRVSCGHSLPKYIYSKAWCPIRSMQIQHFVFLHLTNVKDNKYDSTTGDWLKATWLSRYCDNYNRKYSKIGATTLSHLNLSGYIGHVTIFSWMFTTACCLVVGLGLGLGLGLDLVSGW